MSYFYEPVVHLSTGNIESYEVLYRGVQRDSLLMGRTNTSLDYKIFCDALATTSVSQHNGSNLSFNIFPATFNKYFYDIHDLLSEKPFTFFEIIFDDSIDHLNIRLASKINQNIILDNYNPLIAKHIEIAEQIQPYGIKVDRDCLPKQYDIIQHLVGIGCENTRAILKKIENSEELCKATNNGFLYGQGYLLTDAKDVKHMVKACRIV